ncbi:hypothetical protein KIPB_003203 [Kipferlia bialata]|uniref:Uncharacterized protein n=1 Tax=Kipferlia bialata TaxID=797122 RepID=A0A9K3CRU8_9EUKA|nr:hypothetical protein KIPB_003203 [Kipferlia bialata]|eukprot:g3203.t1
MFRRDSGYRLYDTVENSWTPQLGLATLYHVNLLSQCAGSEAEWERVCMGSVEHHHRFARTPSPDPEGCQWDLVELEFNPQPGWGD